MLRIISKQYIEQDLMNKLNRIQKIAIDLTVESGELISFLKQKELEETKRMEFSEED